jgi:hypothetical protein
VNDCGNGTASSLPITINTVPGAAGTITGTSPVCPGSSGTYSITSLANTSGYVWSYSGTGATLTPSSNSVNVAFALGATGGTLSVYGLNSCGNGTSSSLPITVSPLPDAAGTISGSASVCPSTSGTYSTSSISNATDYSWSYSGMGATLTPTGNSVSIAFAAGATSGDLSVYGVNSCGNGISSTLPITVSPLPGAAGTISGPSYGCPGSSGIAYSVIISNATTYIWNYSGSDVIIHGTGASVTLDFGPAATSGDLTVYGVNSCGNGTISAVYPVTINLLTGNPVFTSGSTVRCKGVGTEIYTATADNSTSITYSISASGDSNTSFNTGTGEISWKNNFSGTAYITATATGLCGTTVSVRTVTVYSAAPSTPGTITGITTLCQNQSGVSYSISTVANAADYTWSVPAGATIISGQGSTGIIVNYTTPVSGKVSVRANNSCGSSPAKDLAVTVRSLPTVTISGTATVCKDAASSITFTNPTSNAVTVTYNINEGALLTKGVNAGSSGTVSVGTGTPGTYVYNLVSVEYQSGTACSNPVSGTATVTVDPIVGSPTAITVAAGTEPTCQPSSGTTVTMYSTTATNSTGFNWSVSNPAAGSINSSGAMTWTNGYSGIVTISVTPQGCGTATPATKSVTVNPLPVISVISGDQSPRVTSSGVPYVTQSGKTGYTWSLSGGGTGAATNETYNVNWTIAGNYTVYVNYIDGNGCTALAPAERNVSVKPLPTASGVTITGYPSKGTLLTGNYTYSDGSTGSDASTFRWLRDDVVIPGATTNTYTPVDDDINTVLTFEVTPKSTVGTPNTGTAVLSAGTDPIENITGVPVADELCITGVRKAGSILRGYYRYTYNKPEGISLHKWFRKVGAASPVQIASGIEYAVQPVDTLDDTDIIFGVIPVSSNKTPVAGVLATSDPIARITDLKSLYSIVEPDVTLTANIGGGFFSGPGVTGNIFSPADATAGYHKINYFLFIEKTDFTCSQKAIESLEVDENVSSFSGMKPIFCHNDAESRVDILNVPPTAVGLSFRCTDGDGIRYLSDKSVTIIPANITPEMKQLLSFSYYDYDILFGYYTYYEIIYEFSVEYVSPVKLLNLDANYCIDAADEYLSIEGIYPPGGTGIWTGSLLSDTKVNSAYFNPADGTAGTTYTIGYQYKTTNLCLSPLVTQNVTVNALPNAEFTLQPSYNIDGGSINLIPIESGGVFSGNGVTKNPVSGYNLNPDDAGTGDDNITYTISNANECKSTRTYTTNIRRARGAITGIPAIICYSNTSYNIVVKGLPKTGVAGCSFVNTKGTLEYSGDSTAVYSVVKAGSGDDKLTFSYYWDGVYYEIPFTLKIDKLDAVSIKELKPGDLVCSMQAGIELTPQPLIYAGGLFTGPVSGTFFDPSKAKLGKDTVTYTFTSELGCKTKAVIPLNVFSSPVVDFEPLDVCINNDQDLTKFTNKTVSADPVSEWTWTFYTDEGGTAPLEHGLNADYLFTSGGLKKVNLEALTDKGCRTQKEKTFNLGKKPEADFYWLNDCMHTGQSIKLVDSTRTFQTPVISRSWSTLGGQEFGTLTTAYYPKLDTGFIKVMYIVKTSYLNCHDTVIKSIYIRPSINLPADGYFQGFETGKGGWIKDESSSEIWTFGTPDGTTINKASSGVKAWFTGNVQNGSASIESPCFDFNGSLRPLIKIDIFRAFEKDKDGVALQYKIGDSKNWQYVGTIDDGIEWYNSATVRGEPGGNQLGWSGIPDDSWKQAIHTLDELKGKNDVKFRIAYGSAESYKLHDGFAFDNIWIGERERHVLLEHFTNITDVQSGIADVLIDTIASHKKDDVINIQYHTNFPGNDQFNENNPGDVSARTLFYGLVRVPYTFIDGGTNKNYAMLFDNLSSRIDSNLVTKRSLINAPFKISINPVISGGVLSISGMLTATEDINIKNLDLYIVVTEKKKSLTVNGTEKTYFNIFRKFIPDAGGIILSRDMETVIKGQTIPIAERTWIISKILNYADLEVIAFIQNSVTKEVLQSFSVIKPDVAVGVDDSFIIRGGGFSLYPNPATDKLTIGFSEPLRNRAEIKIYSYSGELVRTYSAGAGSSEFMIEDPGLKGGIYMVRISMGLYDLGYRKLIISGE